MTIIKDRETKVYHFNAMLSLHFYRFPSPSPTQPPHLTLTLISPSYDRVENTIVTEIFKIDPNHLSCSISSSQIFLLNKGCNLLPLLLDQTANQPVEKCI